MISTSSAGSVPNGSSFQFPVRFPGFLNTPERLIIVPGDGCETVEKDGLLTPPPLAY